MGGFAFFAGSVRADDPAALELFEKEIRPLLVARCYECHGPEEQEGGLRLDSRAGWHEGGDSGPAIVPGKPDESLLIEAVRYEGFEMPPDGKLPRDEIAALAKWVRLGAPDPRVAVEPSDNPSQANAIAARDHWAYQPPVDVPLPDVAATDWPRVALDRFILAKLAENDLEPSPDADRRTLIRRLYYDLIGLPPTPEEVAEFVDDPRDDAYRRLVDKLLASPHFGERWARHWLDVARFAESVTLRGFVFPDAWRYRDWVIDAFNRDLPYDQFVQQQIAGDLLAADSWQQRRQQMIATTFLMLGNTNYEEQDKKKLDMDVVDEQLDTLGKAFLAQTIGCARCHDHKFDPIPTSDYYALAGILRSATAMEHANVSKWIERPLPVSPESEQKITAHEDAVASLELKLKQVKRRYSVLAGVDDTTVFAVAELPGIVVDSAMADPVGDWTLSGSVKPHVGDGYLYDGNSGKGAKTLTFHPELSSGGRYEVRFAYTPHPNRAPRVPITILHADGETVVEVNQQQRPDIDSLFVSLGEFRFERGNQGYVLVSNEGTKGNVVADAVQFLSLDEAAEDNTDDDEKAEDAEAEADELAREAQRLADQMKQMERRLKRMKTEGPQRPKVMTVREDAEPFDLPIHIRGNVHNLGDVVPRGFLEVASTGYLPTIPTDESGRKQLADWMASPENPLAARVMVNRAWHWLFGAGLVRTVDNFGTTGDTPSHPELLDYLAIRFTESNWSVKSLVREIVLSGTYQMSSDPNDRALAADPENRLVWRMNRRRLDAEAIRDTILEVSGALERDMHGASFESDMKSDYGFVQNQPRRSVYMPVFRNALPEIFEVFDFPEPSMVAGRRNTSTVAPQALFLMNHPFVIQQAESTARRVLAEDLPDDAQCVDRIYQLTLGRPATDAERKLIAEFVDASESDGQENDAQIATWAGVVQAVFASPEFRYLN